MYRWETHAVLLLWAFFLLVCSAEGSPFLWALLGGRPGHNEYNRSSRRGYGRSEGREKPPEKTYGDLCRVMNSSPWTAFGYSEPNCPP